ncbi:hypothetical protein HJC99_01230 [Candidatus Saccharibacteria bacterium]|nr:hypothetical protein [Candidatus Saccharibacteria bacterium]
MKPKTTSDIALLAQYEQESLNAYLQTDEAKLADAVWAVLAKGIQPKTEEQTIFYGYHTQVSAAALLATTSLMRQHTVQAYAMLRNACENICNALFGLLDQDNAIAAFKKEGADKRAESDEHYKSAAYAWIKTAEPDYSNYLQDMKKTLFHAIGAHSSVAGVAQNFTIEGNTFSASYLDTVAPEMSMTNLLMAVDFMLRYLEVIIKYADTAGLSTPVDLPAKVAALRAELERLKVKNEPAFRAYQKRMNSRRPN